MSYMHGDSVVETWSKLSVSGQLGNIGSEVSRSINWKNKGNKVQMQNALNRALELFDLTLSDSRWSFYRLREIRTAKEVVCDFIVGDNEYKSDEKFINSYFLQFAIMARSKT